MPKNQFQRMVLAFITVAITVHAYVFFSLYVIHRSMFTSLTGETGVLSAIDKMGGVPVFGKPVPIWAVMLICILYITFLYSACSKNHFQSNNCSK